MEGNKYITKVYVENIFDYDTRVYSSSNEYSFAGMNISELNEAIHLEKKFIKIESDNHEDVFVRTEDIVRIEKFKVKENTEGDSIDE